MKNKWSYIKRNKNNKRHYKRNRTISNKPWLGRMEAEVVEKEIQKEVVVGEVEETTPHTFKLARTRILVELLVESNKLILPSIKS